MPPNKREFTPYQLAMLFLTAITSLATVASFLLVVSS